MIGNFDLFSENVLVSEEIPAERVPVETSENYENVVENDRRSDEGQNADINSVFTHFCMNFITH